MRLQYGVALAILIAATISSLAAASQRPYTISDHVNLVLLDVSVRDGKGAFVDGLTRDDFKVIEDGRRHQISNFAAVDTPVTIGLINDNSGSMRAMRPEVVTAGLAFAKASNSEDQFFVVNFNDRIYLGLPQSIIFTDKLQTLRAALYFGQPAGQTALYDAIALGLEHLTLSSRDKRTLIVVSDGGDNVSKTKLTDLLRMVEASQVTIYTVGLMNPDDRDLNPGALRKLASLTGGRYFQPASLDQVLPAFEQISREIRSRYTISFYPDPADNKRSLHTVKVAVDDGSGRKLIAKTRTSYSTDSLDRLLAGQRRSGASEGKN